MTPEELLALRDQLPPFGEGASPSSEMRAFCRFYGINFTDQQADLEHLVGWIRSGDYRLAVHQWLQPGAVANLLVVHGYYDHTGLFGKLVEWGLGNNCNVLIFDLPGHGLSSGEPAVIDDFSDYGSAVADALASAGLPDLPWWTMAQSTGCAALTEFAKKGQWPFAAAVFLAPLVQPAGWAGVRLGHMLLNPFLNKLPRKFAVNTTDKDFLAFVVRDPLQCRVVPLAWVTALRRWLRELELKDLGVGPVLMIQGQNDHTVNWRFNTGAIKMLYPGTDVHFIPEAGHQLANESPALRRRYLDWVLRYLADRGIRLRPHQS